MRFEIQIRSLNRVDGNSDPDAHNSNVPQEVVHLMITI